MSGVDDLTLRAVLQLGHITPATAGPVSAPAPRRGEADDEIRGLVAGMLDVVDLDEETRALVVALGVLAAGDERAWTAAQAAKHPRGPGGRFVTTVDRLLDALTKWKQAGNDPKKPSTWKSDPFPGFDREQLRRAAKARGLTLPRGAHRDTIVKALAADLASSQAPNPSPPTPGAGTAKSPAAAASLGALGPPSPGAKFEVLADPGLSGDGYAPGGQWGIYGAAGVLIRASDGGEPRFLLVQRGPGVSNNKGKWQLPGGALNSKEDPYQAAARETVEEVGAPTSYLGSLTPVGEHVYTHEATGWSYTTIAAESTDMFHPSVDGTETSDAQWFTAAEIEQMRAQGQLVPKLDNAIGPIIASYAPPAKVKVKAGAKKKTPPGTATAAKAAADAVRSGDFSQLVRVGAQLGSNEGGVFEAPDGSRWYVKAQKSAEHAGNEALAAALYRQGGIDAPEVVRGSGAPGLSGQHHTATRILPDVQSDLKARIKGAGEGVEADQSYVRKAHRGFALDVWLANWDVTGLEYDNIVSLDGDPVRIDAGGALLFRAMGAPKGSAFGPAVTEWDSFTGKESTRLAAALFGSITPEDMIASVDRVKAITPAKIRSMVKAHGLDPSLAETLIARRKDLISRAKAEAKRPKKPALEGLPALKSVAIGVHNIRDELGRLGASEVQDVSEALDSYKSTGYIAINKYLLGVEPGDEPVYGWGGPTAAAAAGLIDTAFAAPEARLRSDIIVYRGERNPSRNFGEGKSGRLPKGVSEWSQTGGMEGAEWTFKAYASTSADIETADEFTRYGGSKGKGAQPTVMRILVPAGTGVLALDEDAGIGSESELLLDRDLRYRVVKDRGVDNGGIRRLDVVVVS